MKIKILFLLFIVHLIYNLEKLIYINEIFVLVGLYYFVIKFNKYYSLRNDRLISIILFLLLYGLLYGVISFFFLRDGNAYQFARTLPVWYSIFAFFLGIEFYNKIYYNKKRRFFKKYAYLIGVIDIIIGGRLSNFSLIPLLFEKHKRIIFLVFIFILVMALFKQGSTSYIMLVLIIGYIIIIKWKYLQKLFFNKLVAYTVLISFFIILYYMHTVYNAFYTKGNSVFGYDVDENMLWRIMYWSYEFSENVLSNPIFGIGFGTELFDINDSNLLFIIHNRPGNIDDLPYVHGTHNSFLYVLVRMGLVGFIPLISIYFFIFKKIKMFRLHRNQQVVSIFLSFLFINVSAIFNVVLESSLYSGIYWILLGMLYMAINSKSQNNVINKI